MSRRREGGGGGLEARHGSVLAEVMAIVRRHVVAPEAVTSPDLSLFEDLGMDSVHALELETELIAVFGVPLADWYAAEAEREGRHSLASLARFVADQTPP